MITIAAPKMMEPGHNGLLFRRVDGHRLRPGAWDQISIPSTRRRWRKLDGQLPSEKAALPGRAPAAASPRTMSEVPTASKLCWHFPNLFSRPNRVGWTESGALSLRTTAPHMTPRQQVRIGTAWRIVAPDDSPRLRPSQPQIASRLEWATHRYNRARRLFAPCWLAMARCGPG